jgi:hypothetical protein
MTCKTNRKTPVVGVVETAVEAQQQQHQVKKKREHIETWAPALNKKTLPGLVDVSLFILKDTTKRKGREGLSPVDSFSWDTANTTPPTTSTTPIANITNHH